MELGMPKFSPVLKINIGGMLAGKQI